MEMTKALKVIAYIEMAYNTEFEDGTRMVWVDQMHDLDYEEGLAVAKHMVATVPYKPVPAHFRGAVADVREAGRSDGLAAWDQVCASIVANGWDGDHSGLPPDVCEIADAIGWRTIGMSSTDDAWMQKHYIARYEARAERRVRGEQAPIEAGTEVEALADGLFREKP